MGDCYRQLTFEERCELARLQAQGAAPSAKSRQLWIARQQPLLGK